MGVINSLLESYNNLTAGFPSEAQIFIKLLILTLIVAVYAVFIWKFYIFISTRDILRLDLNKYNKLKHPFFAKIVSGILYFIEYIIIMPLLIFFWFAFFTILLAILSKGLDPEIIVLIAAITIAAVRITSYIPKYGESVSGEVAKILPITLLAISITDPLFFNLQEISNQFLKIPQVINEIGIYVFFIIALELLLRFFTFVGWLFSSKESKKRKRKAYLEQN